MPRRNKNTYLAQNILPAASSFRLPTDTLLDRDLGCALRNYLEGKTANPVSFVVLRALAEYGASVLRTLHVCSFPATFHARGTSIRPFGQPAHYDTWSILLVGVHPVLDRNRRETPDPFWSCKHPSVVNSAEKIALDGRG